jgi:hypothetical protein
MTALMEGELLEQIWGCEMMETVKNLFGKLEDESWLNKYAD